MNSHVFLIKCCQYQTNPPRLNKCRKINVAIKQKCCSISDVAAENFDLVGLAGSAIIRQDYALFEAIHGSASTIANQNIANPSGLLNATIMLLVHIGQADIVVLIENA